MIKVEPVGGAESISQHAPHYLPGHGQVHDHDHAAASTFSASLLSQHALQLDPDGQTGGAATPDQLAQGMWQLLALLEERLADMRERALLAGGQPSHGLFNELVQVGEVVERLCQLWRRLQQAMSGVCEAVRGRMRAVFAGVHFLLRVLQHSAEPAAWQAQRSLWERCEALFEPLPR
jgi:hypothetical protein